MSRIPKLVKFFENVISKLTLMGRNNSGVATIQSIVGHADVDMTMHYLHVQDSIRQAAIDKFNEAFGITETERHHLDLVKTS